MLGARARNAAIWALSDCSLALADKCPEARLGFDKIKLLDAFSEVVVQPFHQGESFIPRRCNRGA